MAAYGVHRALGFRAGVLAEDGEERAQAPHQNKTQPPARSSCLSSKAELRFDREMAGARVGVGPNPKIRKNKNDGSSRRGDTGIGRCTEAGWPRNEEDVQGDDMAIVAVTERQRPNLE